MTGSRPHVVWLTLDSVRADHTSMAGYRRDTTPNLDRIAAGEDGAYFDRCFAHARYTLPSTASILGGVYPSVHRLGYDRKRLSDALPTVPELFSRVGYRTECVSANDFLSAETGLDRGFDRFDLLEPSTIHRTAGLRTLLKFALQLRHHSAGFQFDLRKHATARLLTQVLKRRIRSYRDAASPVFLYAHYNETHMPYYPPLSQIDRYTDATGLSPREAGELSIRVVDTLTETIANGCDLSGEELEALIAMYDAELRYTDERLGELFDLARSELDDVVFVVTSDHGEFFGERGLLGHRCVLDNVLLNVPTVTHGLGDVDPEGIVQHTDIASTLLGAAGGDPDPIQGVDLRETSREYAISQDGPSTFDHFLRANPDFDASRFPAGENSVIQDGRFKLAYHEGDTELYELPDERTDRAGTYPAVAADLEDTLSRWLATEGAPIEDAGGHAGEFSEDVRRRLTRLGYIDEELS